jgi:hypothetical protein
MADEHDVKDTLHLLSIVRRDLDIHAIPYRDLDRSQQYRVVKDRGWTNAAIKALMTVAEGWPREEYEKTALAEMIPYAEAQELGQRALAASDYRSMNGILVERLVQWRRDQCALTEDDLTAMSREQIRQLAERLVNN